MTIPKQSVPLKPRPRPYPAFDGSQRCAQTDPYLFFPDDDEHPEITARDAQQTCADCPFVGECLSYALSYNVKGIWGGTTYQERQSKRKVLRIKAINLDLGDPLRTLIRAADPHISSAELAAQLGCSDKTVQRHRARAEEAA